MNRKKKTTRNVIIINKRTNERDLLKYSKKRMSRQLRYRWLSLAVIQMSYIFQPVLANGWNTDVTLEYADDSIG